MQRFFNFFYLFIFWKFLDFTQFLKYPATHFYPGVNIGWEGGSITFQEMSSLKVFLCLIIIYSTGMSVLKVNTRERNSANVKDQLTLYYKSLRRRSVKTTLIISQWKTVCAYCVTLVTPVRRSRTQNTWPRGRKQRKKPLKTVYRENITCCFLANVQKIFIILSWNLFISFDPSLNPKKK